MDQTQPPARPPARLANHNSWTAAKQQRFLDHLADTGSVAAAALHAGVARASAYRLRRQPGAEAFARAWDAALANGEAQLEAMVMDRLVAGEEEVIERDGVVVEVRRRPCDVRLLMFQVKRQDDRRNARAALRQAVMLRRMEARAAGTATARDTPPDASLVSHLREQIAAEYDSWQASLPPDADEAGVASGDE